MEGFLTLELSWGLRGPALQPRPALNFFGRHPFQRGTLPQNLLVHRGASKLQTHIGLLGY